MPGIYLAKTVLPWNYDGFQAAKPYPIFDLFAKP